MVGIVCANDKISYHNILHLRSDVGIHDLALEKAQNVNTPFDPKSSFKKL